MISRFWDLGFSTRRHFRISAFEQTRCSTSRRSTFVRPSRGRESVPSEPPRLRDICIDHTSCPACPRTPHTGPERAHAAPGGPSRPCHRMYLFWRIPGSSKKDMAICNARCTSLLRACTSKILENLDFEKTLLRFFLQTYEKNRKCYCF